MPIITLTTDFGTDSPYIAAMKGVILSIQHNAGLLRAADDIVYSPLPTAGGAGRAGSPDECRDPEQKPSPLVPPAGGNDRGVGRLGNLIIDITHSIPPQDIRAAALVLADTWRWFPAGTIHVVVVDPGVGTNRRVLCMDADGHLLIGPDNGILAPAVRDATNVVVYEIAEPQFRLPEVSNTFHGRDIMAPAAAHLCLGVTSCELGPPVEDWVPLDLPEPVVRSGCVEGEVLYVDSFGNLISNVTADDLDSAFGSLDAAGTNVTVRCGRHTIPGTIRTYAEASNRATVALIGSSGRLEIAVVNGNAARQLALGPRAAVVVESSGR